MIYNLEISEECIANGRRQMVDECPVALAFRDATGFAGHVDADPEGIYVVGDSGRLRRVTGPLPPVARYFIEAYDAGVQGLPPFEFRIGVRF